MRQDAFIEFRAAKNQRKPSQNCQDKRSGCPRMVALQHLKSYSYFLENIYFFVRPNSAHNNGKIFYPVRPAPFLLVLVFYRLPISFRQNRVQRNRQINRLHLVIPVKIRKAFPINNRIFAYHINRPKIHFH